MEKNQLFLLLNIHITSKPSLLEQKQLNLCCEYNTDTFDEP